METWSEWYERYDAYQRERGRYGSASAWRTWLSPRIGSRLFDAVTRDDVENLRDDLDSAIVRWNEHGLRRGSAISGRTAMAVWWALTAIMREARRSKRRDLRVLSGVPNPCADVEPPGDRASRRDRQKPFIYPSEAERLLGCAAVPRVWRELHAIAAYTYLRPGELRVLRWSDVDLRHRVIQVTRAWDSSTRPGRTSAPKTRAGVRDVPIEPALAPLLQRMRNGRSPNELVVPVMVSRSTDTLAWRARRHLALAGVDRAALHVSTATTVRACFRSWRDSGITWLALNGLGVERIMRRAGHEDIATTMGYIKRAEDWGGALGRPLGPLPRALVRG